ncbi:arylsulfatase [Desertihabitans brevis]|uniref:Arylsulfatase n=1 Tax=Desertihabitans brevis TaxID=2268447 RepID=A0A367YZN1_9ACTN|nr:arylsulfatase [Desertihabitans brevis]
MSRAAGPRRRPASRPNVLVICVDQWRGDALSAAGHPVVKTPHLDELAGQGTRFSRAYSATPTCVPARVAMFTGQSQERHGRTGYRDGVPFHLAHPVTMQSTLREAGYQTQAVGKMHVYPERSRCGFDDVRLHDGFLHFGRRYGGRHLEAHDDYLRWLRRQPEVGAGGDYFDDGVGCNSMVAIPWNRPEHLHPTNWVVQETLDFLDRRDPTAPFFAWVSFHRPHAPFNPPQWAFDQYWHGPRVQPPVGDWIGEFEEFRRDGYHQTVMGRLDPESHHRAMSGYYGNISHIDLQINRLMEGLADHELFEETSIVFVSDHGEMMGDHDMYRKSVGYEGSAHVPFVVRPAPAFFPDVPRGQVVDDVTELRDLMPTVLEMAGVEVPATVDGRSLLPHVRGERPGWRSEIHGEHTHFEQSLQWVTDGRRKYLWASARGVEQFFDLETDPHELHDLSTDPSRAAEVADWRARLVGYLEGREEGFVADGELVTGRPVRTEASWVSELAVR